jgi:hypothetical protein
MSYYRIHAAIKRAAKTLADDFGVTRKAALA